MVDPSLPDPEKLAAVRSAIPSLAAGIYLNTGSVGPLPAETAAAMADMAAYERDLGRAHMDYFNEFLDRMNEARAGVAAVLGTDVGAVALNHSTTDGMNGATLLPDWRGGGRAVTTAHEHAGAIGPLYALRDRNGIDVAFVDAGDDGDDARTVAAFDEAITADTKLVSISHVLWTTGAVLPVGRIAEIAHDRGALFVVDGAQAAGAIPFRFDELGADLYAVPAQKWLLGPEGMGALVVDPAVVEHLQPSLAGWFSFETVDGTGGATWWPDARRFEASGYHRPSVVGMARSIGWLSMFVGLDFVQRRGPAMAAAAVDRLAAIPGVRVLTPRHAMATLVTFRIEGWPAQAALDELGSRIFLVARTIPTLDALRLSIGFFTTDEELDRVAEAVELLATHTPETLPPRRTLAIFGQG
ncbi:MAG: aminotransferase class V-fold PLP-dependent enzyme [Chloroflexota bacterium]